MLEIRLVTTEDHDVLLSLLEEEFAPQSSRNRQDSIAEFRRDYLAGRIHNRCYIACHGTTPLGYVLAEAQTLDGKAVASYEFNTHDTSNLNLHVQKIFVKEAFRGNNLAPLLKQYVLKYAEEHNYAYVTSLVAKSNAPSIRMNEKLNPLKMENHSTAFYKFIF